jgi:hypothetical protein
MGGPGSGRRKAIPKDEPAGKVASRTRASRTPKVGITTPSGTTIYVLNKAEQTAYRAAMKRYQSEFEFTAVSDLEDLGNLLFQEVLILRYQTWLGIEADYAGTPLGPSQLEQYRRNLRDISLTVASLKNTLGISRSRRRGESETVSDYLDRLRARAKAFGVMRDEQAVQAIVLMKEIQSQVRTFLRATTVKERKVIGLEDEAAVLQWLVDDAFPRFDKIDENFRRQGKDPQMKWAGTPEKESRL